MLPSPTSHNLKLLVQQRWIKGRIMKMHKGGRFLSLKERSRVLGFPPECFADMEATLSPRQICSGLGNTIIVPVVSATLGAAIDYLNMVMDEMMRRNVPQTSLSLADGDAGDEE
jgi:hypothetical protein